MKLLMAIDGWDFGPDDLRIVSFTGLPHRARAGWLSRRNIHRGEIYGNAPEGRMVGNRALPAKPLLSAARRFLMRSRTALRSFSR